MLWVSVVVVDFNNKSTAWQKTAKVGWWARCFAVELGNEKEHNRYKVKCNRDSSSDLQVWVDFIRKLALKSL